MAAPSARDSASKTLEVSRADFLARYLENSSFEGPQCDDNGLTKPSGGKFLSCQETPEPTGLEPAILVFGRGVFIEKIQTTRF